MERELHFLVAVCPTQGQINPAFNLAQRIITTARNGAHVTFSTTISGHRRMFPNLSSPDEEFSDGGPITYIPYSDGHDDGFKPDSLDYKHYLSQFKASCSSSLSSILDLLSSRGQQVHCVIYSFLLPWVADTAHAHGIPSAMYWIQPATVFAMHYHYFNGYGSLVSEHRKEPAYALDLPGLRSSVLQIRDLPTVLTMDPWDPLTTNLTDITSYLFLDVVKEGIHTLGGGGGGGVHAVLVNSMEELEADAFSAVGGVDLIGVGLIQQLSSDSVSLFKPDEKMAYMRWLDSKPKSSVVYVSFGSMAHLTKPQVEEILKGLKAGGRPYLWVLREDCRFEGIELEEEDGTTDNGMVVEWCSQVRVLRHPSVGCFVTHCGWNSTLESVVSGVPAVAVPQWSDQATNAMLIEKVWGTGVCSQVLSGEELARCLDLVLGEEERGVEIRRRAQMWKEKATEAVSEGGASDCNLKAFIDEIARKV